jgi:thymidylate synthase
MNRIDTEYQDLLAYILGNGVEKKDRTGTGTLSIFGWQIRHNMKDGFPLLTTKKMAWKSIVIELLWFLRGDTNIKYLVDNGCHIWDGDAYKNYVNKCNEDKWMKEIVLDLPFPNKSYGLFSQEEFINKIKTDDEFAEKWGELGPIYGKQWRSWETTNVRCRKFEEIYNMSDDSVIVEKNSIDQIANLISELKTNPDSRRLMVNAWNVGELDQMVLPPCHYGFQVYTRELSYEERCDIFKPNTKNFRTETNSVIKDLNIKIMNDTETPIRAISLMYNTRSQDVPLGTPFNIASYALLLEIIAKEVNMVPDELIANMGDCHIYLNQKEGVVEQLTREPYPLPKLKILDRKVDDIAHYEIGDFIIEGYQSHPAIKIPLSN